jgi:LPXTG-motif cell wall-anchored protein
MNSQSRWIQMLFVLTVGLVCLAFALSMNAQVQTETSTRSQASTVTTKVASGEVVYVNGNDLIVKMDDGTLRHFPNVPDSAKATVDGKEIGIHDVKVGMKLQKTMTTTATPKVVTTTQTVTGKIFNIIPPTSVILTLEDGTNQQFNIPKGQKFNVDGQMVDAWGLKKGMKVSATRIVEEPIVQVEHEAKITGSMPPPPPPPPQDVPILVAVVTPPPAPAPTASPAELPKTGSSLPLIGLLGLLSLAAAAGLRTLRSLG